jgi:hypothetical protein
MLSNFQLSRKVLSSYYIAVIFSALLFRRIRPFVIDWSNWLTDITSGLIRASFETVGASWLMFFVSCFILTVVIRQFVVEPLGFFIKDEGAPNWELGIIVFLVLGAYIYNLNLIFGQPMPSWLPDFLVNLVYGIKPGQLTKSSWDFVPWLWDVVPIVFMFVRSKLNFITS